MSYDPKVWTSEPLPDQYAHCYWMRRQGVPGCYTSTAFYPSRPDDLRSILPIPSAEVYAALVELAEACAHADRDARMLRSEYLWRERISAALARLDAARKERGA